MRPRTHRRRSRAPHTVRCALALLLSGLALLAGCQTGGGSVDLVESGYVPAGAVRAEDLLVVDCLLPGQVRKLGRG